MVWLQTGSIYISFRSRIPWYLRRVASPPRKCRSALLLSSICRTLAATRSFICGNRSVISLCTVLLTKNACSLANGRAALDDIVAYLHDSFFDIILHWAASLLAFVKHMKRTGIIWKIEKRNITIKTAMVPIFSKPLPSISAFTESFLDISV